MKGTRIMANAENFAPPPAFSKTTKTTGLAARITGFFRNRANAAKTERAVRNLDDHIRRDIGLIGKYERSTDFDAELRRIHSSYAW